MGFDREHDKRRKEWMTLLGIGGREEDSKWILASSFCWVFRASCGCIGSQGICLGRCFILAQNVCLLLWAVTSKNYLI